MNVELICANVEMYRRLLGEMHIVPERLSVKRTFASASREELLAHAQHLVDYFSVIDLTLQYGKANRHLTAIQMCLSFAGVYTLGDLLEHKCPK